MAKPVYKEKSKARSRQGGPGDGDEIIDFAAVGGTRYEITKGTDTTLGHIGQMLAEMHAE